MVTLVTVSNGFQARVVAARLGSAGVLAQVRGPADGPYPIGDVNVVVPEVELELARQLMLADEVEAVFDDDAPHDSSLGWRRSYAPWVVVGAVIAAEALATALRLF
jgi:hypothetical protein